MPYAVNQRCSIVTDNSTMRWQYRDAGLLWLFVPAYVIHVGEEWAGGFPAWIATVVGRALPAAAFFTINGVALVLVVAGIRAAIRDDRHGWIAIAIATIVLINVLAHAAGGALTRSYSPGLISAFVLYLPLGSLALIRAFDQASRPQLARGIVAGVLLHLAVFIVAYAFTR